MSKKDPEIIEPKVSPEEIERAIKKLRADDNVEMVRIINLAMTPCTINVSHSRGYKRTKVPPFGLTPLMPRREADRYVTTDPGNHHPDLITVRWVDEPPVHKPGKRDSQSFVDGATGITVPTSTWAPLKNEKILGNKIHHSVSQAQHFMAKCLKTIPGVRRYITEFDNRPAVTQYATLVIDYLHKQAQAKLGYSDDGYGANV